MTKVTHYFLFIAVCLPAAAFGDLFAVFFAAAIVADSLMRVPGTAPALWHPE